jgi:hypothetical protein
VATLNHMLQTRDIVLLRGGPRGIEEDISETSEDPSRYSDCDLSGVLALARDQRVAGRRQADVAITLAM